MRDSRFLKACRGEPVDRTPIWVMRQAGRYLPEYREIRKGRSMLEAVSTPDIAAEVTLMPIRRLGFDAAILFSDLTVPFTPMGAPFDIKEGVGPVVDHPIRTQADLDGLCRFEPEDGLSFVMETIRILKRELTVPLIGFTGAPFTLASYLIEGGPSRDHKLTRTLMRTEPVFWHSLMALLADNTLRYLQAQIRAGADAVQLFDSWVGVLDEATYRECLLPHMKTIFEGLAPLGAPTIHFGTGTAALLRVMQEAGGDVIGVDWRISLTDAAKLVQPTPMQGNLDPAVLLTTPQIIKERAQNIVREGRHLPGHVFNLGHGIYPETPLHNVEALMEAVWTA
ncbi:MAG: uroporphyrinogen decarboxylase [Fimbriimonas sp.]|nr:uroporphyrinogen decarboxylase [Fimbriimonas sp.]